MPSYSQAKQLVVFYASTRSLCKESASGSTDFQINDTQFGEYDNDEPKMNAKHQPRLAEESIEEMARLSFGVLSEKLAVH